MTIRLAADSNEILPRLQRSFRVPDRPPILRLALAQGIMSAKEAIRVRKDSRGPEIPVRVLTAGQDTLYDALITEALEDRINPKDRKKIYKSLVDFGLEWLNNQLERAGDPVEVLLSLAASSSHRKN